MKGKRARVKIADLKRRSIRQDCGTAAELKSLAMSWLERPAHDIIVCPSLTMVDGHRRLEGLELLGETEIDVFITEEELDENQILQVGLTTAIHRADLCGFDKWQAGVKLLELNPGWRLKDLAAHLHIDVSSVTRLASVSNCSREWQEALKARKVGVSDCYEASQLDEPGQASLLALKLLGASRDTLKQAGRRKRLAATPAVRASKIKCPLPSGHVITVAGDELSLDEAIDSLKEAIKAMTKARDTGLNVATAQQVWADMAKSV